MISTFAKHDIEGGGKKQDTAFAFQPKCAIYDIMD
jgi:hypothetical protein